MLYCNVTASRLYRGCVMGSKRKAAITFGAAIALSLPAAAQTPAPPTPTNDSGVIDLEITYKRLDAARSAIQPSLGATTYSVSNKTVDAIPQGDQPPLNQVLMRAPGVTQDIIDQIHIRGDHPSLQYPLDRRQTPE